jgi:hypothetical protein
LIRRLVAWTMPRRWLVEDMLSMANERDRWRCRAERAERIADEAVAVAARYHEALAEEQSRNASLAADLDRLVFHG